LEVKREVKREVKLEVILEVKLEVKRGVKKDDSYTRAEQTSSQLAGLNSCA
jgi:hypothetical protein